MSKHIDYVKKSDVLKSGICPIVLAYDLRTSDMELRKLIDIETNYTKILWQYGKFFVHEARKINNAYYQRVKRLRERIKSYIDTGTCVFITLTFNDDTLQKTNADTRRRYVSRFLRSLSSSFIANIDFGEDDRYSHREHYHCLLVGSIKKADLSPWSKRYGFTWIDTIHKSKDSEAIARYISKLTNHAIKSSTKRQVYIYSRS